MTSQPIVVDLAGELDLATIERLDARLAEVPDSADLVIDLRLTTFLDSVTLALLVQTSRRLSRGGGRLVLAEARGSSVRRVLSITQIDRALPYADTVAAALALLADPPSSGSPSAPD